MAEPGAVAHHGPLEIQGNSSVSDQIIRRQLSFRRGDLFRQSKLLESQRRLYSLEVFQFANVQPVREAGEQPTEIPTRVTVTEGKHRKVNFSFGYGTEERARVEADWRHVNFFGGARTAEVLARYSRLDGGLRLNLKQPYFINRNFSLGLQGQYLAQRRAGVHARHVGRARDRRPRVRALAHPARRRGPRTPCRSPTPTSGRTTRSRRRRSRIPPAGMSSSRSA